MTGGAASLLKSGAVRERCQELFELALEGRLEHFHVDGAQLEPLARYVAHEIRRNYPSLNVPFHSRWRHFMAGGVDRAARLLDGLEPAERARARFDLAVTSVLLDAGSGPVWRWHDPASGEAFARSEGLALASLALFESGALSSREDNCLQADAEGLASLDVDRLAACFQVEEDNPLAGLEGRVSLLNALGEAIAEAPEYFSPGVAGAAGIADGPARIGYLFDYLSQGGEVRLTEVLEVVLRAFAAIWPDRMVVEGVRLGDTWRHPQITRDDCTNGLIPFHKLSQWLTYSLAEPLQDAGVNVTDVDGLTGLAEYRNGGLFVDGGVLRLESPPEPGVAFEPEHGLIVEWRALTVALLDRIAPLVWSSLGVSPAPPLVVLLQGGTWSAGRRIAAEKREGGRPPIEVISDGTVF